VCVRVCHRQYLYDVIFVRAQAEARCKGRTVNEYEQYEEDAWEELKPGLGSKLAHMFKRKGGACSKVHNVVTNRSFITSYDSCKLRLLQI